MDKSHKFSYSPFIIFLLSCVLTFCPSCSGLQPVKIKEQGRGPISYPIQPKVLTRPTGQVIKRNNIQRRFQFNDGTILGLGSDNKTIYTRLDGTDRQPITTPFTIFTLLRSGQDTIGLSNFGKGIILSPNKKPYTFTFAIESPGQTSFISALALPDHRLIIGTNQNTLLVTPPIYYNSSPIISLEHKIILKNSPDMILNYTTPDHISYAYTINIKEATITEINLSTYRRAIFQLMGNSIGGYTLNNNSLVSTDPRKKAINVMTLDPLVTRIYVPVHDVPRNVCFITDTIIAVTFPALNTIETYSLSTGTLKLRNVFPSISNITHLNCTNKAIIADGEDNVAAPATQIISFVPKKKRHRH